MPAETVASPPQIEVLLNGEKCSFAPGITLVEIIEALGLPRDRVAVEFDRQIVKRELWSSTKIAQGSEIEIVQFVGGG